MSVATKFSFGRSRRAMRRQSAKFVAVAAIIVLSVGYIHFLNVQNRDAGSKLQTLQKTDTAHYLESVRQSEGFVAYLREFTRYRGYDTFHKEVPPFLLGRWALFSTPQKVGYQFIAEDCINFLAIEDGEMRAAGDLTGSWPVQYRVAGSSVEAKLTDGSVLPISLASYGMDLHHIVVTLPGETAPHYGYLCK